MSVSVSFLGAAGTVTGSKYLIRSKKYQLLVDAGAFQGKRKWRERNWLQPPIEVSDIDAVLLTHAHIDHTGILPRYHSQGLSCPVFCSSATIALAELLLPDMGRIQEEDTEYRKARGYSRHKNPLPLYREADAISSLKLFQSIPFLERKELLPGVYATWYRMGHILGAAAIRLEIDDKVIVFSGDIGRYQVPILVDPSPVPMGDLLLVESTYGNRAHADHTPMETLAEIINETHDRGGVVVIPSFAIGRAQLLLYYIRELKEKKLIPDLPIIVDSPMATNATAIYRKHVADYDDEALGILKHGRQPFDMSKLGMVRDRKSSQKLNSIDEPMVLISASGMLTGGRILHHLKHRIGDPRNSIVFVGYQPPGGRGDWIQSGADSLRIFGQEVPIRAQIKTISGLSAHADKDELLRWCKTADHAPSKVAIVHGEPKSAKYFENTLKSELGWSAFRPEYQEELEI